jgi:hypothetical protein
VCMCLLFVAIERGLVKEVLTTYELNLKRHVCVVCHMCDFVPMVAVLELCCDEC